VGREFFGNGRAIRIGLSQIEFYRKNHVSIWKRVNLLTDLIELGSLFYFWEYWTHTLTQPLTL